MNDFPPGEGPGSNTGHGHVWPRPDGVKARCGGPGMCKACALDASRFGQSMAEERLTTLIYLLTRDADITAEQIRGLVATRITPYRNLIPTFSDVDRAREAREIAQSIL